MLNTRRLFGNALVSVAQTVISGVTLFILYRYLIINLGTKQLGLWSVVLASTSVARLSDMGLTGSVVKFVALHRAKKDDDQAAEVVQTAAISIAGVMALLCLAAYPILGRLLAFAIPASDIMEARTILPWAAISIWIGSVGGVFQSALDGCQRLDIRNIIIIIGNIFFTVSAFWLVPSLGVFGLAVGQVVQSVLVMLIGWFALRTQLKILPRVPYFWSKTKFKNMFGYAVNIQITSIAILCLEPVTKLLMSRYGGLIGAANYEMAYQFVIKLRSLLSSAVQALVPAVAEIHEVAPEKVRSVYLQVYRMVFFISLPFFGAIYISLPMVSQVWLGRLDDQFTTFGEILSIGWGANSLTLPAYFVNQGAGNIKWNSISHLLMAAINILLGYLAGRLLGGFGVVVAGALALLVSTAYLFIRVFRHYKIPFSSLFPIEHRLIAIAVLLGLTISQWLSVAFHSKWSVLAGIATYVSLILIAIWVHPYRTISCGLGEKV